MTATILRGGTLLVVAQTELEAFALQQWMDRLDGAGHFAVQIDTSLSEEAAS